MKATEKKMTFGLIVGTRGFFNSALAVEGRKSLITLVEKLGIFQMPVYKIIDF